MFGKRVEDSVWFDNKQRAARGPWNIPKATNDFPGGRDNYHSIFQGSDRNMETDAINEGKTQNRVTQSLALFNSM
jgi:hypothetical protein